MKAIDAINSESGARTIYFGDLGDMKLQWAMRTAFTVHAIQRGGRRFLSCNSSDMLGEAI